MYGISLLNYMANNQRSIHSVPMFQSTHHQTSAIFSDPKKYKLFVMYSALSFIIIISRIRYNIYLWISMYMGNVYIELLLMCCIFWINIIKVLNIGWFTDYIDVCFFVTRQILISTYVVYTILTYMHICEIN